MAPKFLKSVHVPHRKNTKNSVPQRFFEVKSVTIPMSMHIGAPAKPVVKVGDHVKTGQLIGEPGGFVSAPIYASISGTVKKVDSMLLSSGGSCMAVTIESDGLNEMDENIKAPELTDFDSFIQAVRSSGVVGLGGAGFPTSVKLKVDPAKVDYILINGAECEPYITSDTRTMCDDAEWMLAGLEALRRFFPATQFYIGIENNKPEAIKVMRETAAKVEKCEVIELPSSYPQGGEKVLIYNTTGRIVPEGKLPLDAGCIVLNVTTLAFIGRYLLTGEPLSSKCITIDGSAVKNPQNLIVPVGTMISEIVEHIGGLKCDPAKALYGGPMMGLSMPDLDQPILKNTNAVLIFDEKDAKIPAPTACIRCGRCVDACPLQLMPAELAQACEKKDLQRLSELKVNLCMECGSCSFVCPAKRNLVESHKLAKQYLREAGIK
ncbi:MAG: electron transport complex subunit RsxC [Lachnospiraceae bacterium]|nr:electron transport complex subunit RsxC [Lachnospiraceae bacterium]